MKRSKAKKILQEHIFIKVIGHFVSLDGEFGEMMYDNEAETFAEEILKKLEDLGMTPPDVCREEDPKKYYNSTKHAAHFHMGKSLHYWESEDDDDDHPRSGAV